MKLPLHEILFVKATAPFSINSIWAEYIPKRGIQGAPLMERRSTAYEDLTSKALLRCLVAVSS